MAVATGPAVKFAAAPAPDRQPPRPMGSVKPNAASPPRARPRRVLVTAVVGVVLVAAVAGAGWFFLGDKVGGGSDSQGLAARGDGTDPSPMTQTEAEAAAGDAVPEFLAATRLQDLGVSRVHVAGWVQEYDFVKQRWDVIRLHANASLGTNGYLTEASLTMAPGGGAVTERVSVTFGCLEGQWYFVTDQNGESWHPPATRPTDCYDVTATFPQGTRSQDRTQVPGLVALASPFPDYRFGYDATPGDFSVHVNGRGDAVAELGPKRNVTVDGEHRVVTVEELGSNSWTWAWFGHGPLGPLTAKGEIHRVPAFIGCQVDVKGGFGDHDTNVDCVGEAPYPESDFEVRIVRGGQAVARLQLRPSEGQQAENWKDSSYFVDSDGNFTLVNDTPDGVLDQFQQYRVGGVVAGDAVQLWDVWADAEVAPRGPCSMQNSPETKTEWDPFLPFSCSLEQPV